MSYEGYEIRYCRNGHRGQQYNCYSTPEEPPICPVCKEPMDLFDAIDETNGCVCAELGKKKCPAHPKVNKIIAYDNTDCKECEDGWVKVNRLFRTTLCECNKKKNCKKCSGSGLISVPDQSSVIEMACRTCKGRGRVSVPVYDVNKIRKSY